MRAVASVLPEVHPFRSLRTRLRGEVCLTFRIWRNLGFRCDGASAGVHARSKLLSSQNVENAGSAHRSRSKVVRRDQQSRPVSSAHILVVASRLCAVVPLRSNEYPWPLERLSPTKECAGIHWLLPEEHSDPALAGNSDAHESRSSIFDRTLTTKGIFYMVQSIGECNLQPPASTCAVMPIKRIPANQRRCHLDSVTETHLKCAASQALMIRWVCGCRVRSS